MPYRHLSQLLDSRFDSLSPELQRAARWLQAHPAELGLQSMRQSALAAGVAPATMTRLARALGLDGFEAMRRPSMVAFAESVARTAHPGPDLVTQACDQLAQAQAGNLKSVRSRNSAQQLHAAAQAILDAREVLFLGLRASFCIAYHLHYTCDWLRANTRLATDAGGAWADQVLALAPGDLLVVVSQAPYTRQIVEAAQQAHARGVPVLALTDSSLSPLARLAQRTLLFDTASPSFFHSMVGAQALAETLMDCVAEQGGSAVVERLARRQQGLQAAHAYWEKKPPRQV
ncbi:MurR/RpiR family transcriptional regulator [Rhodoferax ferrireducens]|uniref:MurR/RpiR family transcriptional regulator n=1 Tax=Rhodoferax ferrireducens TaxID=192843 RepID=UPI00298E837D|nr:MurR/RpiR family transcriptional regulator [Rhodoferax ferrireducens]WPC68409.1 MurR/RpiR family transcriptional regulator [Rhodoferax ferrireducens]